MFDENASSTFKPIPGYLSLGYATSGINITRGMETISVI